eukprot:m51a1_g13958 hypothetical protein (198) ;mRNA; f:949106-949893
MSVEGSPALVEFVDKALERNNAGEGETILLALVAGRVGYERIVDLPSGCPSLLRLLDDRDAATRWLHSVVKAHHKRMLALGPFVCSACGKPATTMQLTPQVYATAPKPFVLVSPAEPLCGDGTCQSKFLDETTKAQSAAWGAETRKEIQGHLCAVCGKTQSAMMRCSRCRTVEYCSAACQKQDWPQHKQHCAAPASK